MAADTYELLAGIVAGAQCKPGWFFELIDEDGAKRLVIRLETADNYAPYGLKIVRHLHPVPAGVTYNEKTWRRWIFDQCIRVMNHEIGESLRFGSDEVRPFEPLHGPGEDPYTVHEFRPEIDARTTQNGSIR